MSKVGYLKVLNHGEYFEIERQKRKQGFIPYETNSLASKYVEFQSMFKSILTLSNFDYFLFNPTRIIVNKTGGIERNNIHDEFHKYAGKSGFITSIETLEDYHFENYPSNKIMGRFRVRGEMIVENQLFEFSMQAIPCGIEYDGIYFRDDFLEAQTLWDSIQKVKDMLNRGYWVPITLPKCSVLDASKKHLEWANEYKKNVMERYRQSIKDKQ